MENFGGKCKIYCEKMVEKLRENCGKNSGKKFKTNVKILTSENL